MSRQDQIATLEAQIKALRAEEQSARELRRAETPLKLTYYVKPVEDKMDRIFDPEVVLYRVGRTILNKEEASAAGWSDHDLHEGAMNYLYNKATGRIIMAHGGGYIYLGGGGWSSRRDSDEESLTMHELATFIVANPDGGDITHLVEAHNQRIGKN